MGPIMALVINTEQSFTQMEVASGGILPSQFVLLLRGNFFKRSCS